MEAEVLCCADEAVLCRGCDQKVHSANKLSQKHDRVLLLKHPSSSSSLHSHLPPCDICQERNGYFFCLEDRALLCKHCDMTTHMGIRPYPSSHQRFLIAGLNVSLQSLTNNSRNNARDLPLMSTTSFTSITDSENMAPTTMDVEAVSTETRATFFATELHWPLDEMFDTNDYNYYNFSEVGSSS